MTMLAPSRAARSAMARPMPREPPLMKRVFPLRSAMALLLSRAEARRPLRNESGHCFGKVAGCRAVCEGLGFSLKLHGERCVKRVIEELLRPGQRFRWSLSKAVRQRHRPLGERRRGHQFVHKTKRQRLRRIEAIAQ